MADAQNSPHVGGGRKSWRDSGRLDPDVLSSLTIMDEDVELLTLSHFTKPPRLDFGTVKLGKTKCCKLNVHNPEEFEQEVVLERFASKKGFKLDQSHFIVKPRDVVQLTVEWIPLKEGSVREMALFKVEDVYRLTAILYGRAEHPPPKTRARGIGWRGKRPLDTINLPNKNGTAVPDKTYSSHKQRKSLSPIIKQGICQGTRSKSPVKRRRSTPKKRERRRVSSKENTPAVINLSTAVDKSPVSVDGVSHGSDLATQNDWSNSTTRTVTPPCIPGSPSIQFVENDTKFLNESIPLRTTPPCIGDSPSILFVDDEESLDPPHDIFSPPIRFVDTENYRAEMTPKSRTIRRSITYTKINELPDSLPITCVQKLDLSSDCSHFDGHNSPLKTENSSYDHFCGTLSSTYISEVEIKPSAEIQVNDETVNLTSSNGSILFSNSTPVKVTDTAYSVERKMVTGSPYDHDEKATNTNMMEVKEDEKNKVGKFSSSLTVTKSRPSVSPITTRCTSKRLFSQQSTSATPEVKIVNESAEILSQDNKNSSFSKTIWGTNYEIYPLTYQGKPSPGSPRLIRKNQLTSSTRGKDTVIKGTNYEKEPLTYSGSPTPGSPRLITKHDCDGKHSPVNKIVITGVDYDIRPLHCSGYDVSAKEVCDEILNESLENRIKRMHPQEGFDEETPDKQGDVSYDSSGIHQVPGPFSKRPRIEKSQNINAKKVKSACDAQQDKKPTRTEILRKQAAMATMKKIDKRAREKESKHKRYAVAGVAKSKLTLNKSARKTVVATHPMPFAAKNMYYDERWMEKQERGFTRWLNFVLTPVDEYADATKPEKDDAGSLYITDDKSIYATTKLAPTKEQLSFAKYSATKRMNSLRHKACLLFQSDAVVNVIHKLETEVDSGRLAIRRDRKIHADIGIKQNVLEMILSFNPLWLRICLETVFGEMLCLPSNLDVLSLSHFVSSRLLGNPDISRQFAHPTVPHLFKEGYEETLAKFILKKFLILVFFLDQSKRAHLVDHDPCLFCKDSLFKSNRQLLQTFSREYLAGEGDLIKHLGHLGYRVNHTQTALDEYDYAVNNIALELRDGVRLTRIIEIMTKEWQLTSQMRVPAISRLQKIHNVQVAFNAISKQGLAIEDIRGGKIDVRDIVDGHREKSLALLWRIIFHFQIDMILDVEQIKQEIRHLEENMKLCKELTSLKSRYKGHLKSNHKSSSRNLYLQNERLSLLLKWCQAVCAYYGMQVDNFTVSFSDGRCLCYLIHHYHPCLLGLESIHSLTTQTYQDSDLHTQSPDQHHSFNLPYSTTGSSKAQESYNINDLLANEKQNFILVHAKVKELGGMPLMLKADDMSNTIPDEKVVITYVSHLCARLLDLRHEIRAARIIQTAWRKHCLNKQILSKQIENEAIIKIQNCVREFLLRRRSQRHLSAAVKIQSWWQGLQHRRHLQAFQKICQFQRRNRAAMCIQRVFRAHLESLRNHDLKNQAAVIIQRRYLANKTGRVQYMKYQHMRAASIRLQACVRGWLCRRAYQRQKTVVITMQAAVTRFLLRSRFLNLRRSVAQVQQHWRAKLKMREDRQFYLGLKQNVTVIQAYFRSYLVRKEFLKQRHSCVKIQSYIRMYLERSEYHKMKAAAVVIQTRFRAQKSCIIQRQIYHDIQRKVLISQSVVRRFLIQRKLMRLNDSARVIQRWYRTQLIKKQYKRMLHSTHVLQTHIRAFLRGRSQRRMYEQQRAAVVLLQYHIRNHLAQKRFKYLKAVTKLQALIRGWNCRQNVKKMHQCAVMIQSLYRGYITRKILVDQKRAATVIVRWYRQNKKRRQHAAAISIQALVRGYLSRRQYARIKKATVKIQSHTRKYRGMLRYKRIKKAVICIQRRWRATLLMRQMHTDYQVMIGAAMTIQAAFRGWAQRKHYQKMKYAAVIIQHRYRGYAASKLQRARYQQLKHAALCVQAAFRGRRARQAVRQERAAVKLQSVYRMYRERCRFINMIQGFTKLQALVKGKSVQKQYQVKRTTAIYVQCCFRRMLLAKLVRKEFMMKRQAAICLQKHWRRYTAVRTFEEQKSASRVIQKWFRKQKKLKQERATTVIQSHIRTFLQKRRYQHLRKAVVKIQSLVRKKIQLQRYKETRRATVCLQRRWRATLLMRQMRTQYRVMIGAAMTIQAAFRGYQVKRHYMVCQRSVILIQASVRGWTQRKHYQKMRHAAVIIQHRYRGYQVSKQLRASYQQLRHAALCVQAAFRVRRARQAVRQERAAVKIQSVYRMYRERCRFISMIQGFTKLQALVKGNSVQKQYQVKRTAAIYIQCCFRRMLLAKSVRKEFMMKRQAAICLQKHWRRYTAVRTFEEQKSASRVIQKWFRKQKKLKQDRATTVIQSHIRTFLQKRRFQHLRNASVKIQSLVRKKIQVQRYKETREATVCIQRRWRATLLMQQMRTQYRVMIGAAMTLQASVRGWMQRKHYQMMRHAAVIIQHRYRGYAASKLQRARYQQLRRAALQVQAAFRGKRARRVVRQKRAAVKIQSVYRMYRERCRFISMIQGFTKLQALVKGNSVQKQYQVKRTAAIYIQCCFRRMLLAKSVRKEFMMKRQAAICLQKHWRRYTAVRTFEEQKSASRVIQKWFRKQKKLKQDRARTVIQSHICTFLQKRRFQHLRKAAMKIQSLVRKKIQLQRYKETRRAIVCLQRRWRATLLMRQMRTDYQVMIGAAMTIQAAFRGWMQRKHYQMMRHAAVIIQHRYRGYAASKLQRTHYQQLRRATLCVQAVFRGKRARQAVKELKAAIRIQSFIKMQQKQSRFKKMKISVIIIQRGYREYRNRILNEELKRKRILYLQHFSHVVSMHLAAMKIQLWFRRHLALQRAKQTLQYVIVIQRWIRSRLQRISYLRTIREQKERRRCAVVIQAWVRRWLVQQEMYRRRQAALTIQAVWRAHAVRMSISNHKLHAARKRLKEATQNATPDQKLGNRTTSALDFLLKYKQLSYLLDALMHIETATRLSSVCCEKIVEGNAIQVIYKLIRGCNRSLPHMEIIKYSIKVLLNLAKYEKTVEAVFAVPDCIEILLDLFQIYREKGGAIFTKSCTLMAILAGDSRRKRVILQVPRIVEKLQSIHALTHRKHSLESKRLATKNKMMASKMSSQSFISINKKRQHDVKPEWVLCKNKMNEIEDPLKAINFVIEILQIPPKIN